MEALQQALEYAKPKSLGQQLGEKHMAVNRKALWMFQQVEKINNNGAILAAFDHFMEADGVRKLTGKAYEDARNAAYEKAKGVQPDGQRCWGEGQPADLGVFGEG